MLCPLCHTQNRDNAKFCKGCGQLLAVEVAAVGQPEAAEQYRSAAQAPIQKTQGTQPSSPLPEDAASIAVPEDRNATNLPFEEALQTEGAQSGVSINGQSAVSAPSAGTARGDILNNEQNEHTQDVVVENRPGEPGGELDVSQMPTQILTPQQMLAFHARRWEQDRAHEQADQARYDDIADAPTILVTPPSFDTESTPNAPNEVSESTIDDALVSNGSSAHEQNASTPVSGEQQIASHTTGNSQAEPSEFILVTSDVGDKQENSGDAEASSPGNEATAIPVKENNLEQSTNTSETTEATEATETAAKQSDEQKTTQTDAEQSFPTLEVGATIGGRYEVAQVTSETDKEHIYTVTDHQGYQHCWNCASEQNAEGDEFCIDCGAELLNASYILHAYPVTAQKGEDAQVLQGTIINTFVDQGTTYVIEQPQATQTAFPNGAHLLAACDSDAGTMRRSEPNEDSTLVLSLQRVHESISSPAGLFVVADGMGGHANGQGASRLTIALLAERVTRELLLAPLQTEKASEPAPVFDDESFKELLRGAIEEANTALCQVNQKEKSDMGSTLTGFMIVGDYAYIFNVGDSRTYMLRDEKLYQLTNDHSLVGQLVAGGLIEPDDVYTHPQRNQIFRSIGDKQNVQVDLFTQQVHPGDVLLSCSDGLWEMVRNPQIAEIINQAPDPYTACTHLIEAANTNGGEDNVSAVIVYVR